MKLMTKEIEKKLPKLYATDGQKGNRKVAVKFFTPWTNWTWYALEGERNEENDIVFFGLVCGPEKELGYFTMNELASIKGPYGLKVERDRHFDKTMEEAEPEFCEKLWGDNR
jgi:hypothetical protein